MIVSAAHKRACPRAASAYSRMLQVDLLAKESEAVASELFNVNEDLDVQALQDEVRAGGRGR